MKTKDFVAGRLVAALAALLLWLGDSKVALAQLPASEEQIKILTDPEDIKKKEKEKTRPPIEMFISQVAPFDILPFVKRNHWSTLSLEMQANYNEYAGTLQTAPVMMLGLPQEIIFRRDAHLPKAQRSKLGMQVLIPTLPKDKSIDVELTRLDAIRADEIWKASVKELDRRQMLILFMTKESNDAYAAWNRFQALYPVSLDRSDQTAVEKERYFRLVLPLRPEKPPLSTHPLTWTTISHVIWDGMPPDYLNPGQQQALLDWLHWGGQLTLIGGANASFSILNDSFLAPYLPAEITGESALLTRKDLEPLAKAYPPPYVRPQNEYDETPPAVPTEPVIRMSDRYLGWLPIKPAPNRPVYLAGLKPKPGATAIPLGEGSQRILGVEQRVGHGRILMLGLTPTDPALATWRGIDSFVRRVILRRPEANLSMLSDGRRSSSVISRYGELQAPDLSWFRLFSRDVITKLAKPLPPTIPPSPTEAPSINQRNTSSLDEDTGDNTFGVRDSDLSVAEWNDKASLARLSRETLEEASGIKIPSSTFVLKVVLAYILTLVPLNWLICRYVFGRKELAWIVVPTLSLGFAVAVERAAAYDMGYNSACDEIDIIEFHGGYPRAHVSRFASLYSTGRTRYSISFPNDPTGLALPLDNGRSLRGEEIVTSVWNSFPIPMLEGFLVQPRSLAMFRSEQMPSLDGSISLVTEGDTRKVLNESGLQLRDAVVVELKNLQQRKETYLGDIAPGASIEIKSAERPERDSKAADTFRGESLLREFREFYEDRLENRDEIRLVAWVDGPLAGQKIEPAVDRHRGFTAVVVHLKKGAPPSPDAPLYYEKPTSATPIPPPPTTPLGTEAEQIRRMGPPPGIIPPNTSLIRGRLRSSPSTTKRP